MQKLRPIKFDSLMRVRVPNIFGTTMKTDPTLLRYASAITEQIND